MRSTLFVCLLSAAAFLLPVQAEAACGDGIVQILDGEQCDVPGGTYCCIGCQFQPTTTMCRSSTGVCDVPEFCSGGSTSCPSDGFRPSTTLCRESPGSMASRLESTRGPSNPLTTGTVSTSSSNFQFRVGAMGSLRTVTATSSDSLQNFVDDVNVLKNSAPENQRVSASLYNSGSYCQADAPDNTSCLTNADCVVSVACATTYKVLLLAETRGADFSIILVTDETELDFGTPLAGEDDRCNPTERCNGTGASCPGDAFQNSAFVCRATAGSCDIVENCPNNPSLTCPTDTVRPEGTDCRPTAGVCDPEEVCTGVNAACPDDSKTTAVCRPTSGSCDPTEVCDGVSDNCPADVIGTAGIVCRGAAGVCDIEETCDGVGLTCPPDALEPGSTTCRPDAGQCDVADFCTGTTAACPADAFEPVGTSCTDGDECTIDDQCVSGVCSVDPQHCGDGVLAINCTEECDDGNLDDVDGCSSLCLAEPGLGCPFYPLTGCRPPFASNRSTVLIRDEETIGKLKFQWRYNRGAATTEVEFGDPVTDAPAGTSYTLCVYDSVGLLVDATAPAGGQCGVLQPTPCWRNRPGRGFRYADSDQSIEPDGVKNIDLVAGPDGKSSMKFIGTGGLFPFPSNGGFGGIADLSAISSPLTVQLQNTNGLCWEATYSAPFQRAEPGRFQASSD